MMGSVDVLVVGAGIVGSACALECTRADMSVCVVDSGCVGGGATAAGMGHLVVLDDSDAQLALSRYSQQIWNELADELPPSVQFYRCGTLWVASDEDEMTGVHQKKQVYAKHGLQAEQLDANALQELEPNLRRGLAGGLRVPGDSVIYPPTAARYFLDSAKRQGATLHEGRVASITDHGVTLTDGSSISAGAIVNAAGAWASSLSPRLPVRKRKGISSSRTATPVF